MFKPGKENLHLRNLHQLQELKKLKNLKFLKISKKSLIPLFNCIRFTSSVSAVFPHANCIDIDELHATSSHSFISLTLSTFMCFLRDRNINLPTQSFTLSNDLHLPLKRLIAISFSFFYVVHCKPVPKCHSN